MYESRNHQSAVDRYYECIDDVEGMIGCADPHDNGFNWDLETKKRIKLFDRFLKKNGYKREY